MQKTVFTALSVIMLFSACTWVKPIPEADRVQYVDYQNEDLKTCSRIGSVTTSVKAKIGFFNRSEEKVNQELITLARNEAALKGGNTVAAEKPAVNGRRVFVIYQCAQ